MRSVSILRRMGSFVIFNNDNVCFGEKRVGDWVKLGEYWKILITFAKITDVRSTLNISVI